MNGVDMGAEFKMFAGMMGVVVIASVLQSMTRGPADIEIVGFHYVYQGAYNWVLTNRMLHGQDITHIGFDFKNNKDMNVGNITVEQVIDGTELSPPLDRYFGEVSQPFEIVPGITSVWYSFTPSLNHYITEAKVNVAGNPVAISSLEFDVEYD